MSDVMRRFEHLKEMPDDAEYATLPILAPHEPSTCRKCGAAYDAERFTALALPPDGNGVWTFASATLAVRRCTCGCLLGRRTQ